jgi:hypothetical protein
LRPRRIVATAAAMLMLVGVVLIADTHPLTQAAQKQLWGLGALHHAEFDRKLPARQKMDLHIGRGGGKLQPEAPVPQLEVPAGFYSGGVEVTVRADLESMVHCSFDGSIPTRDHERYTHPIALESTTVVRCRAFRGGYQPSDTATRTYFIDAPGELPVLAVTADPTNLWNAYTGIYRNFSERGSEWERDASVEYLPRENAGSLALSGKLRMHGFYSRTRPKKSLRFYYAAMPTELHDDENLLTWSGPSKQRVIIFGARESKVSRDELFQELFSRAGGHAPLSMPVALYINGEYWGIYYVRERIDQDFLDRHLGPGQYDLLDGQPGEPRALLGDRKHWDETIEFFRSGDFSDPAVFAQAAEWIDIDNFTDYWLFNIYAANRDWPHHNMKMFRRRDSEDGRWRWISWDADGTFNYTGKDLEHDTFAWATRSSPRHDLRFNNEVGLRDTPDMFESATLFARKLLENPAYRQRFEQRMAELLNGPLSKHAIEPVLDAMHSDIASDLTADWARWAEPPQTPEQLHEIYRADLDAVRHFVARRPSIVMDDLRDSTAR